jgi:hypothetical protein
VSNYRLIEETPEERAQAQAQWEREILEARQAQNTAHAVGIPALRRLFKIANGNSGQCGKVAGFLLGLYNGSRFPFDMTNFRAVDGAIFDDMMMVLRMDSRLLAEVHTYFDNGGQAFEQLASDWNLHSREWEPADQGFMRRRADYRLNIEARVSGSSVLWAWSVERWEGRETVSSGDAYSVDSAKRAIDEWFDRGGENPIVED